MDKDRSGKETGNLLCVFSEILGHGVIMRNPYRGQITSRRSWSIRGETVWDQTGMF